MKIIAKETHEEDSLRSWYVNTWYYIGSDDNFDYLVHQKIVGIQHEYAIKKQQLKLEKRFEYTTRENNWVPIEINGKTRDLQKELEEQDELIRETLGAWGWTKSCPSSGPSYLENLWPPGASPLRDATPATQGINTATPRPSPATRLKAQAHQVGALKNHASNSIILITPSLLLPSKPITSQR